MMTTKEKMNPKKTSRIAGFLYLLAAVFAPFSVMYVPSIVIVPGDAAATASNIMANELLFRMGFVSGLIYQIIFMLYVLVVYKLLKPVNKTHALLMLMFLLVGVPIAVLNKLNQFAALLLLSGADYLTVFTAGQLRALVMLLLELHKYGELIAVVFWGVWLFPLGFLVFKSGFLPRILGVLLIIGGFGYLIDSSANFLLANYEAYEAILSPVIILLTFPGELLLALWFLIKGVNVEQWEKRALESA